MKFKLLLLILFCANSVKGADFEKYFPHLIKSEGILFTVTQYDRGGATKYGVTMGTYKIWCNSKLVKIQCDKNKDGALTSDDLRSTTLDDVRPIYKKLYWDLVRADEIKSQGIAELIGDMTINCGTGFRNQHIKSIQRFVGVNQDGVIGTKTIKAINKAHQLKLYNHIFKYRSDFYKKVGRGNQKKFVNGWLNRINNLKSIHKHEKLISITRSDVGSMGMLTVTKPNSKGSLLQFSGLYSYTISPASSIFDKCSVDDRNQQKISNGFGEKWRYL